MYVVTALKEVLDKYDAEKGPITNYARMLLSGRRGDAYRYNKRHSPDMFSDNRLENPIGDDADGGMTLGCVSKVTNRENYASQRKAAAKWRKARYLQASFSKRIAILRQSLILIKKHSTRCLSL